MHVKTLKSHVKQTRSDRKQINLKSFNDMKPQQAAADRERDRGKIRAICQYLANR